GFEARVLFRVFNGGNGRGLRGGLFPRTALQFGGVHGAVLQCPGVYNKPTDRSINCSQAEPRVSGCHTPNGVPPGAGAGGRSNRAVRSWREFARCGGGWLSSV